MFHVEEAVNNTTNTPHEGVVCCLHNYQNPSCNQIHLKIKNITKLITSWEILLQDVINCPCHRRHVLQIFIVIPQMTNISFNMWWLNKIYYFRHQVLKPIPCLLLLFMGVDNDLNLIGVYSTRENKSLVMVQIKYTNFNYPDKQKDYTTLNILFERNKIWRPNKSEYKKLCIVKNMSIQRYKLNLILEE